MIPRLASTLLLAAAPVLLGAAPNVLLVLVDDLRPELGCYGSPVAITPRLDQLASESLRFDRAYTAQAVCLPSRVSLVTGQHPQTTGVTNLQAKFWQDRPGATTLMTHLRAHGYEARAIGKVLHDEQPGEWDVWTDPVFGPMQVPHPYASEASVAELKRLEREGRQNGLRGQALRQFAKLDAAERTFTGDDRYHDHAMTTEAIRQFGQLKESGKPFLFAVGYRRPHLPFSAPKRFWDLYDREALPLAPNRSFPEGAPEIAGSSWGELRNYRGIPAEGPVDAATERELIHGYLASVSFVDAEIGRLLDGLASHGLAEDTIVVLWGDHGYKLGDLGMWVKHTNFEIDARIPLMIRLPGGRAAGAVARELVESIDLFPTLCELLDLPVPESVEGSSVAYLADDPGARRATGAFSEYERHGGVTGFTVVTDEFRYVEWIHLESGEVRAREFYDLAEDPHLTRNRVRDERYRTEVAAHAALLREGPAGRYPAR